MAYATGSTGLAITVRGSSRRIMIMRFRPANIRLINRRSKLLRLLLALSSGKENANHKNNPTDLAQLTRSLHIRPMHSSIHSDRSMSSPSGRVTGFSEQAGPSPAICPICRLYGNLGPATTVNEFYKKGCQEKSSPSTGRREDFCLEIQPTACECAPRFAREVSLWLVCHFRGFHLPVVTTPIES